MNKNTSIIIGSIIITIVILGGLMYSQSTKKDPLNQISQTEITANDAQVKTIATYKSKNLTVQFPPTYTARENGDMLIVSSSSGKIIIGGFAPSVGYPEANKKDFPFRKFIFHEDYKSNSNTIPTALYYRDGDTKTENELLEILKTVESETP